MLAVIQQAYVEGVLHIGGWTIWSRHLGCEEYLTKSQVVAHLVRNSASLVVDGEHGSRPAGR